MKRPTERLSTSPAQLRSLARRVLVAFAGDRSLTPLERLGIRKATSKLQEWAQRDETLLRHMVSASVPRATPSPIAGD